MRGVYPRQDRVFRPWKNGGGETAEILASPLGADIRGFDWRLSTAIVAEDGPFSDFPGVDRLLAVVEGGPILLKFSDAKHRLDSRSEPLAFAGDRACVARIEGEPVLNLNVMVRRPFRAELRRGPLDTAAGRARASLALLLAPRAGLERLDLVDLRAADPDLVAALAGAEAISVAICA